MKTGTVVEHRHKNLCQSKEQYLKVIADWKSACANPKWTMSLSHYIFYSALRGKDWRKTFSYGTDRVWLHRHLKRRINYLFNATRFKEASPHVNTLFGDLPKEVKLAVVKELCTVGEFVLSISELEKYEDFPKLEESEDFI